jgi:hypothetical protein
MLAVPARAQSTATPTPTPSGSESDTAAVADALVDALTGLLELLFTPIRGLIESQANGLLGLLVGTPHPSSVFADPTTLPWTTLHQYYWETMVPLTLMLFGLAVGIVILLESTSHLFSGYHRARLKRRAFVGLMGILSWWWIAAFSLQLADQLARFITPDLSSISLFQTLSFTSIGLLGVIVTLSVDLVLFGLIALIYFTRILVLYGFVLGMPLLIVAWIPGIGPFQFVSALTQRLAGFYVPLLVMTIPVALLFRLGAILGDAATLSLGGIGLWLTALVIPFVAILSPFLLIWQAGATFFIGEQMTRHASQTRFPTRDRGGTEYAKSAAHTGRNAVRGLRDKPAVRRDGQTLLRTKPGTATDRGHRVGSQLRSTTTTLRDVFSRDSQNEWRDPGRYEPGRYDSSRSRGGSTEETRTDASWGRDR